MKSRTIRPRSKFALPLLAAHATLLLSTMACGRKTVSGTLIPAAPAPVEKPTIHFFRVEPATVPSGQGTVLRWSVANSSQVRIRNGIGEVQPDGKHEVRPTDTTTYKLEAQNAAGITEASATVTVIGAPAPTAKGEVSIKGTAVVAAVNEMEDVHFDYDSEQIKAEDLPVLARNVAALKRILTIDPNIVISIEGHCDEHGSAEFNLGLGDRRAATVKRAAVDAGLSALRLETVSYGKERLLCLEDTEACHAKNRRAHFAAQ
ncbi:MAG: OmpA family protein [Bryobacteraceae bacterium]